jgi:protease-4
MGFWLAILFGVLLLMSAGLNMFFMAALAGGFEKGGQFKELTDPISDSGARDVIAIVEVNGIINSEDTSTPFGTVLGQVSMFKGQLQKVENERNLRALIIEVDSPGGEVTASDEIHHMITDFKAAHSGIPVIVFMRDYAASGGYYISAPADKIVAMPSCTTGSIGVIAEIPNISEGLGKIGVKIFTIKNKGATMKDAGSPFKPLADEAEGVPPEAKGMSKDDYDYFQKHINEMYRTFLKVVYDGRAAKAGWTSPDDAALKNLADGKAYSASEALESGLIDQIGYFEDAVAVAKKAASITEAKVVRYQYVVPRGLLGLGGASTTKINTGVNVELDTNQVPQTSSPKFMYYWKP